MNLEDIIADELWKRYSVTSIHANTQVRDDTIQNEQMDNTDDFLFNSLQTTAGCTVGSDLTVDTTTLKVVASTNRVGIGTASPGTDLHIYRGGNVTLKLEASNNPASFLMSCGSNKYAHINFQVGATNMFEVLASDLYGTSGYFSIKKSAQANEGTGFQIRYDNGDTALGTFGRGSDMTDAAIYIDMSTGAVSTNAPFVGINNLTPAVALDVTGTIRSTKCEVDNSSTYVDKDGSNNMTFTDAVSGTVTLAELINANDVWKKETPTGTINGSNTAFVISQTPISEDALAVYLNGVLQEEGAGNDYTRSTVTITFTSAPSTSSKIVCQYQY